MRASSVFAALVAASLSPLAFAGQFSRVVSFGDSLSDAGNVSANTFGFVPGFGYFNGRFSNGPIWTDLVAQSNGLPTPLPALAPIPQPGASNFGVGGARVNQTALFFGQPIPSFASTVTGYVATGPAIPADALVTIWIGSNDYLSGSLPASPTPLVDSIRDAVVALAQFKGARQFVVLGLPPIGLTPDIRSQGPVVSGVFNAAVQSFNAQLSQIPGQVAAAVPGANVTYFDTFGLFESIAQNPAGTGLSNFTDRAFTSPTVVPNPDSYLYWDGVHPTRVGHSLLARAVITAIPEPSLLALGAVLIPLLARARR